jgi:hypothetical protein
MVGEGDSVFHTLHMHIENPGIIAGSRIRSGLPANRYFLYYAPAVFCSFKVRAEVDRGKHRLDHNAMMAEGQREIDGEPFVSSPLILTGDCDGDVIPIVSVIGEMGRYSLRSFCDHEKGAVGACPYHIPKLIPPFICIFMEEVGREAGVDVGTGRNLVESTMWT